MTPARLARLLDTRGPHLGHWPPAERRAAGTLLGTSEEARALLAEARRMDAALAAALPRPAPDAVARLRAAVAREIARTPLPARPGPWARLAAALRPAVPAGWGALATVASCALWLGFSPAPAAVGDPLAPLAPLPLAEDPL